MSGQYLKRTMCAITLLGPVWGPASPMVYELAVGEDGDWGVKKEMGGEALAPPF
jgi:hypothetical protein